MPVYWKGQKMCHCSSGTQVKDPSANEGSIDVSPRLLDDTKFKISLVPPAETWLSVVDMIVFMDSATYISMNVV